MDVSSMNKKEPVGSEFTQDIALSTYFCPRLPASPWECSGPRSSAYVPRCSRRSTAAIPTEPRCWHSVGHANYTSIVDIQNRIQCHHMNAYRMICNLRLEHIGLKDVFNNDSRDFSSFLMICTGQVSCRGTPGRPSALKVSIPD